MTLCPNASPKCPIYLQFRVRYACIAKTTFACSFFKTCILSSRHTCMSNIWSCAYIRQIKPMTIQQSTVCPTIAREISRYLCGVVLCYREVQHLVMHLYPANKTNDYPTCNCMSNYCSGIFKVPLRGLFVQSNIADASKRLHTLCTGFYLRLPFP